MRRFTRSAVVSIFVSVSAFAQVDLDLQNAVTCVSRCHGAMGVLVANSPQERTFSSSAANGTAHGRVVVIELNTDGTARFTPNWANATSSVPRTIRPIISVELPANLRLESLAQKAGTTCTSPPIGSAGGTVRCELPTVLPGAQPFGSAPTITVRLLNGTSATVNAQVTVQGDTDTNSENDTATVMFYTPRWIVPIVGRLAGANNSFFQSDVKIVNPTGSAMNVSMVYTPRGQSASASDSQQQVVIQPQSVSFTENVLSVFGSSLTGAGRLIILTEANAANCFPTWSCFVTAESSTYTVLAGGAELGNTPTVFRPLDFSVAPETLTATLGKQIERTNIFVSTGLTPVTVTWVYRTATGQANPAITATYAADTTHQFSAESLLGFPPAPNASLQATIRTGAARIALSPVNNVSNQGRWVDFKSNMPY